MMDDMKMRHLRGWYETEPFPLPALTPGMCVVLWTDKGPGGPCGQTMSTTCPWAGLAIFPDEVTARETLAAHPPRRGRQFDIRYIIVGEGGDGQFSIGVHEACY